MSQYNAQVLWKKGSAEVYTDGKYSRGHHWSFEGGVVVPASSSVHVVPLPYSVAENVDPEEAFVASLSSCHMLFFLQVAAKKRYIIERYEDNAVGTMENDSDGNISMTKVKLRVKVQFSGERQPDKEQLEVMHHLSHQQCFIANSVKSEVTTEIIL